MKRNLQGGNDSEPKCKKRKLSSSKYNKNNPNYKKINSRRHKYWKSSETSRRQRETEMVQRIVKEIKDLLPQAKYWVDLDLHDQRSFYHSKRDRSKQNLKNNHEKCKQSIKTMEEALLKYCTSNEYLSTPHKRQNREFHRARSMSENITTQYIPSTFIKAFERGELQSITPSMCTLSTLHSEPTLTSQPLISSASSVFSATTPIQHHGKNHDGIHNHVGKRFSYWRTFKDYEFIKPKYDNLKQELLQNNIKTIGSHEYTKIESESYLITKHIHDKLNGVYNEITCYARNRPPWNKHTGIKPFDFIKEDHILAILVHIHLNQALQSVCQRDLGHVVKKSIQQRHSEFGHCLKYLFESIVLYGKDSSLMDIENAYFGFEYNLNVHASMEIELGMPLRGIRMDRQQAKQYGAKNNGIVLQYDRIHALRATYFNVTVLSQCLEQPQSSEQPQLIFFHASLRTLNIHNIHLIHASPSTITLPTDITSASTSEPPSSPNKPKLDTEVPTILNNVFCPTCDTKMLPKLVHKAYSCRLNPIRAIICDHCHTEKTANEYVYNCPRGYMRTRYQLESHDKGFDLCLSCAELEQYHRHDLIDTEDTNTKDSEDQDYENEESETDYEQASVSSETSIGLYEVDEDNLETSNYIENEWDQSDSSEDEKVTEEERNKFDQVYQSIRSSLRWQCSTIDFDKGFRGFWKSKINELRRSPSSAVLKQDYPLCGTCSFSFGSNVSSPLQCTYGKVPRCHESGGFHHYGAFMPNRPIRKQICFWCDSWNYFQRTYHLSFKDAIKHENIFDYIIDHQESNIVSSMDLTHADYDHKDFEIARLRNELQAAKIKVQKLQENMDQMLGFYDKLLRNVLESHENNKQLILGRTRVGVPFFQNKMKFIIPKAELSTQTSSSPTSTLSTASNTPSKTKPPTLKSSSTTSTLSAEQPSNKDNGKVYFIRCDVFKKRIIVFIYYELGKRWECKQWTNIQNRELLEELSKHFKGVPRCQQPGYSVVNRTVLSREYGEKGETTASVVRVGNINSGAYLIENYFTEEEADAIVDGHRLIMNKYQRKINDAFKVFIEGDGNTDNVYTAETLPTKSTIWLKIIIRYHAVSSPQLHRTDFGRSEYVEKLKEIIDNEEDLNAIIKYVEVVLNSYGDKYRELCQELGIECTEFAAYQTQHYKVSKTGLSERLKGHRDTWKLGDRGFAAGTFINSSTIVFCDRFGQRIIYELEKPVRSLLIVQPQSFMATKAKHKLIGSMETESLSTLARMESTAYNLKIDTERRINRNKSKQESSSSTKQSTARVKKRKNIH